MTQTPKTISTTTPTSAPDSPFIEIDEDGQGEIIIGDADEGIEFGALTSEKAAKELWDTILEELEYYED